MYVLFTRCDRLPFFADYVRSLTNEEAGQVLGITLPMHNVQAGVYAEEETRRLVGAFDSLFYSLADKRLHFLPRESDPQKIPGAYEFPREFRKLRNAVVQFLVDVGRPSQLRTSPFLRGFYFTGVRPVTVQDTPLPTATAAASSRICESRGPRYWHVRGNASGCCANAGRGSGLYRDEASSAVGICDALVQSGDPAGSRRACRQRIKHQDKRHAAAVD